MRGLALVVVGLLLACAAPAWASPALAQAVVCGSTSFINLPGAPANGTTVSGVFSHSPSAAMADSNTVPYPNRIQKFDSGSTVAGVDDNVVAGSPTNNYQLSGNTGPVCAYNMSGVSVNQYAGTQGASCSGTTLTATTSAPVPAGSIVAVSAGADTAISSVTFSNGSLTTDSTSANGIIGHTTTSSLGFITATATGLTGSECAIVIGSYQSSAGVTSSPSLWPWPQLFQPG